AEQKKTVEQLSSQLSEKQVEVKRLQREISNGVRKLKKIVNGTPFSKTSQDEGSAKTSAFEALADFTAKFVESEKESKKQNAIKLAETEKAVLALQAKVSEAEEAFRQANEKHHKAHNTITQIEARIAEIECKVECGVCNERDVDVVFHCGHTMCHKCSEKVYLRGDNCPYCRRRIGYKKKLCLGS
ncbi:E3 ubiquitin-protein ligase MYLIP-like protein, partial [Aphelenchoides avenae]